MAVRAGLIFLIGSLCFAQALELPDPKPWDACDWVAGKGGTCRTGNSGAPFAEFLKLVSFTRIKNSQIAGEAAFDLRNGVKFEAKWASLGTFGGRRLRQVRFRDTRAVGLEVSGEFAGVVVIERSSGLFFPLFWWYGGQMPDPSIHSAAKRNVLAIVKDFGGNAPMVTTWAWIWTASGPQRLQVEKTVQAAIQKVAPGHGAYDTGLDWKTLCSQTYAWGPKGYPGKVGVHELARVCLAFQGDRLVPKSAEWREYEDAKLKRWP